MFILVVKTIFKSEIVFVLIFPLLLLICLGPSRDLKGVESKLTSQINEFSDPAKPPFQSRNIAAFQLLSEGPFEKPIHVP